MTPRRWIVLGALVSVLTLTQARILDRSREVQDEKIYTDIGEMPPGDVLPTYIASLFFGSFRAVAIDFLWIQLKRVEEEKRWYERREILKLISYFQPRNVEVWAMLGWHSAYNVANSFSEPERGWQWVRDGLKWLRDGVRKNPQSPYLKFELAWTLHHKPSWRDGQLDLPLMARIEGDAELQKDLLPRSAVDRSRSPLELAIEWYSKAREEILPLRDQYLTTQMGLNISTQTVDSQIRDAMFLQGIYEWRLDRPGKAKEWFLKSADLARKMLEEYPGASAIFKDYERFCRGLPPVVDLERQARSGRPEDERAFLTALQKLVVEEGGDFDTPDRKFLWMRGNPDSPLNRLKQRAAQGRDPQECNDAFKLASLVEGDQMVRADLGPEGMDVDFYVIIVPPPKTRRGEPAPAAPPRPIPVTLLFRRPEGAALDLRVTVFNGMRDKLREEVVRKEASIEFPAEKYDLYYVKVEPAEDVRPWPPDTRYLFSCRILR